MLRRVPRTCTIICIASIEAEGRDFSKPVAPASENVKDSAARIRIRERDFCPYRPGIECRRALSARVETKSTSRELVSMHADGHGRSPLSADRLQGRAECDDHAAMKSPAQPRSLSLPGGVAQPNKPFQAPRRNWQSASTLTRPRAPFQEGMETALLPLKFSISGSELPGTPTSDPLHVLWARVLPRIASFDSATLVHATRAVPIEALGPPGAPTVTHRAIQAVVHGVERAMRASGGEDEQDWDVVVAWLRGLARVAVPEHSGSGQG